MYDPKTKLWRPNPRPPQRQPQQAPQPSEVDKRCGQLFREYLSEEIEEEIISYARNLSRPEIIQPVDTASKEEMIKLCNICIELQKVRERCVLIYLGVKKARNRLKIYEKDVLIAPEVEEKYLKAKNKESREILVYKHSRMLQITKDRSGYLAQQCEIVLSLIDSHVWTLKANNRVLSNTPQGYHESY